MAVPALQALFPVAALITLGVVVAKVGWVRGGALRDISNLVFKVLAPALLFTSMSQIDIATVSFKPVVIYFLSIVVVYGLALLRYGFGVAGAIRALAATYSNTLMIGVPLVDHVYGQAGLVPLLSLLTVHSLVVLSAATMMIETIRARGGVESSPGKTRRSFTAVIKPVLKAIKASVFHPVPLPIISGLVIGAVGIVLPNEISEPLRWLGQAFSPLALVLLGATLGCHNILSDLRLSSELAILKTIVHPLVMLVIGGVAGLGGMELNVMLLTAALPIGANVYMFAQRYRVAEEEVTGGVVLSTALAALTMTVILSSLPYLKS